MYTLIILGILVGLDNLQASSGIGMLPVRRSRKLEIALAFAFCEATMPLVGLLAGQWLSEAFTESISFIGPLALMTCGALVLYGAFTNRAGQGRNWDESLANTRWALFGLPLLLSFDNLAAGVGLGALGYPVLVSALVVGAISGIMCFAGLLIGGTVRHYIPRKIQWISGAYMLAIALFMMFEDQVF